MSSAVPIGSTFASCRGARGTQAAMPAASSSATGTKTPNNRS
ncbi:hypothetical protein [Actinoplanes sp. NPDC026619]